MACTTVEKVKLFLNRTELTLLETAQVEMLIDLVDGVITSYCGWNLLAADYTDRVFTGNGTSSADLKVYPINSVTSVTQNGEDITSQVSVSVEDGYLYFPSDAGTVFTSGSTLKVTFNGGLTDDMIPNDLVYAATYLVVINMKRIAQDTIGIAEGKFNTIEVKYDSTDIPVLVKRVLDRYRQVSIY